jgi:predicted enzyme related to lactoylglutathione lyase
MEITNTRNVIHARNADLTGSRFSGAKLTKSIFDDVNLQGSSFTNTNLGGARFVDVNLAGVTVQDVNLTGMAIDDVNLQGSSFTNIDLGGARFVDVNLAGVTVQEANLTGMAIEGILVTDMIRAFKNRAQVVLYARNLARMQEFYQTLFRLEVEHAAPDHVVLASPVSRLIIVQTPQAIASNIQISDPPTRRTETPIKLVFEVENIGAARAAAPDLGGRIDAPDSEWTYQECRVCDGQDPEGNVVQLRMGA